VFILPQLMENQPSESIDEELSILTELVFADPKYTRLIRPRIIDLGTDKATLQETALGWIVFGAVSRRSQQNQGRIRYQPCKHFGS